MNITLTENPHDIRPLQDSGAYQWWYFDGISDYGDYTFVVIIFSSFPFSVEYLRKLLNGEEKLNPLDFAAVNFNLYKEGKIVNYFLNEYHSDKINITKKNDEVHSIKIGLNSINFVDDSVNIKIRGSEKWKKRVINAEFDFKINTNPKTFDNLKNGQQHVDHFWTPAGINSSFSAKIKIRRSEDQFSPRKKILFDGSGYYDRNWGTEPMYENILDWKWGRFVKKDLSLVFFDITYKNGYAPNFKKLIISKGDKIIIDSNSPEFEYHNSKNYWRLQYPKKIQIISDEISVHINNEQKIDNGPFYIRFKPEFSFSVNGEKYSGTGISEVIKPQNLKRTWLYPFIKMRISRH